MKIVSFNLRCIFKDEGVNSFIHRVGIILAKIDRERPDIICFQEATDENIPYLIAHLPEYALFFNQRNEDLGGEGLATAVRRDTFSLQTLDFFWLSNTPYLPGSRFAEQSECPRICQCVTVRRLADGKFFRFYNLHLDHIGEKARILGIKAVLSRVSDNLKRLAFPFFILGDFNAEPDSETIAYCNSCSDPVIKDLTADIPTSFHDFGRLEKPCKIDYIYTDENTAQLPHNAVSWTDKINGIYLSDHYPICLEIYF